MQFWLSDKLLERQDGITLEALLVENNIDMSLSAIIVNQQLISQEEITRYQVQDQDLIHIIRAFSGG